MEEKTHDDQLLKEANEGGPAAVALQRFERQFRHLNRQDDPGDHSSFGELMERLKRSLGAAIEDFHDRITRLVNPVFLVQPDNTPGGHVFTAYDGNIPLSTLGRSYDEARRDASRLGLELVERAEQNLVRLVHNIEKWRPPDDAYIFDVGGLAPSWSTFTEMGDHPKIIIDGEEWSLQDIPMDHRNRGGWEDLFNDHFGGLLDRGAIRKFSVPLK